MWKSNIYTTYLQIKGVCGLSDRRNAQVRLAMRLPLRRVTLMAVASRTNLRCCGKF